MGGCSSCRIDEEGPGGVDPALLVGFPPLDFRRLALGLVCAFQLVVPCRLAEQLLDIRRRIVCGRGVDPDDAVLTVQLVPRTQFETGDALHIDAHQMQSIGRHLQRELLHRLAVTAVE